jgi:isocitrate dehydrogenase
MDKTISGKKVTVDLAEQIPGATTIGASFRRVVESNL